MGRAILGTLLVVLVDLSCAPPAAANATYVYTGNTICVSAAPPLDCGNISATVTLAAPLGDDSSFQFYDPISFSISDGVLGHQLTQSSPNLDLIFFGFATDAGGNITSWCIKAENSAQELDTCDLIAPTGPAGVGDYSNCVSGCMFDSSNVDSPGTWSMQGSSTSPTPEPGSLLLLGTGLLGFAPLFRRGRTTNRSGGR